MSSATATVVHELCKKNEGTFRAVLFRHQGEANDRMSECAEYDRGTCFIRMNIYALRYNRLRWLRRKGEFVILAPIGCNNHQIPYVQPKLAFAASMVQNP
jgi:hypothetical protein